MAKFSGAQPQTSAPSAVTSTTARPDTVTHQGGPGFTRDAKSELFLLAVTNMVSEGTFYEAAEDRDNRFRALVAEVTRTDPAWVARLIPFMRDVMNMRSAPIVAAAEYALTKDRPADAPSVRSVIDSAMARADEPAEFIGYWRQRTGRHTLPGGVQRGLSDAMQRLYTERAALKYDGGSRGVRMGDAVELVHPEPTGHRQSTLYRWLLSQRHRGTDNRNAPPEMIGIRKGLDRMPEADRRAWLRRPESADMMRAAGVTWEWLSGWLPGGMDREAWEAVIPSMGYMALLRNLRNFDQAGVSDEVAAQVAARLSDPEQVRRSRQFPFRFLSAYRHAPSLRWGQALETALNVSLENVPALPGRTLILVDRSGSMWAPLSARSDLNRADAAAIFGTALAVRAEKADLVQFGSDSREVRIRQGESVLRIVERFDSLGGTNTHGAIRKHFKPGVHDRVIIVTDEQVGYFGDSRGVGELIPADVPLYTWNLAGYRAGHSESGVPNRHTFGGLTDAAFRMIPLLEAGAKGDWDTLFAQGPVGDVDE